MASSHDILCGVCDRQQKTNEAAKWCPECDEGLCTECEKFHIVIKSSRHHIVISITDYKSLPDNISNIEHYCQEHKREFKNYCPQHDKLCCPLCISTFNKNCSGFMALEDIAKDAKTSVLLNNIEQSLCDTKINIEKIIEDREHNLEKIKEQGQQIHDKIKQTRSTINIHLDEIENKIIEGLDTAEKSMQSEINTLLLDLKERRKSVEELLQNITDVKTHASDLQAFFGTKQLESRSDEEEKYIISMANNETFQQIDLKCVICEKIEDKLTIPSFGSVTMEKGKTTVVLRTEKYKEAQIIPLAPMPPKDISSITLKLVHKFNIPKGQNENCVTGCAFLSNDNLASHC